jgi:RNA polymerase sigma-70 factor, ECF subfamily
MLIAAVLAGDKDQFTELVHRYEPALRRVARSRLGRDDWTDDVVQETLLCAFKFLPSYDSRYSFRTWLWTILLNQCHRQWKRQQRTPHVAAWSDHAAQLRTDDEMPQPTSTESSPPARLLAAENSQRLESLLARLPEAQADALRLRFFGGLKFEEIATALQCSVSTAKQRVRWGLVKMSEWLRPDESPLVPEKQVRHETPDEL